MYVAAVMMLPSLHEVPNQKLQKMEPEFARFRQIFAASQTDQSMI